MKTLMLCCATILLMGCSTTVPVAAKFPEPPGEIMMVECPNLKKLDGEPKLSDVSKIITENYSEYYICAVKTSAWIEWYNKQKIIFESVK
jgi:hypothetical protein